MTQRRVATDDDPDTIVDVAAVKLDSSSKQKSRNGLAHFTDFDVMYFITFCTAFRRFRIRFALPFAVSARLHVVFP